MDGKALIDGQEQRELRNEYSERKKFREQIIDTISRRAIFVVVVVVCDVPIHIMRHRAVRGWVYDQTLSLNSFHISLRNPSETLKPFTKHC